MLTTLLCLAEAKERLAEDRISGITKGETVSVYTAVY